MLEALMGWINHDGGKCPCLGDFVEVVYTDGKREKGIAQNGVCWRYVDKYRLIENHKGQ